MAAANFTINATNSPLTTCSFEVNATSSATDMTLTSAQMLAACPAGPLFDFLNVTYTNATTTATAFRNVLGNIVLRQVGGAANVDFPTVVWVAATSKPALLIVQSGTTAVYEIYVEVSHTIIR